MKQMLFGPNRLTEIWLSIALCTTTLLLLTACSYKAFELSLDAASQHSTGSTYNPDSGGTYGSSSSNSDPQASFNLAMLYFMGWNGSGSDNFDPPAPALASQFGLLGRIELIGKRSSQKFSSDKTITSLNYIEFPFYGAYHHKSSNGNNIFAGIGPYLALGLWGNVKTTVNGQTSKEDAFGDNGFKRFDAGLGATIIYKFHNDLSIGAGYDYGLANLEQGSSAKTKNRSLSLYIGYSIDRLFNKGQKK